MKTGKMILAFAYLRLSREELQGSESGSITNQRMIITNYCRQNGITLVREFADRFTAVHKSVVCRDLLRLGVQMENSAEPESRTAEYYKKRPCLLIVEDAAEIVEEMIKKYG